MKINRLWMLAPMAGLLATTIARADNSPNADALLQQAAQKLSTATSLRADFTQTDRYPGQYKDLEQRGSVTLARPGQLKIEIHRYRRVSSAAPWAASGNDTISVSDGKTHWYTFQHPNSTQVRQEAVNANVLHTSVNVIPPLAAFFDGEQTASTLGQAKLDAPETWEGQSYQVIEYPVQGFGRSASPALAYAYLGADGLVHRLIYSVQNPKGVVSKEWTLRNIHLNDAVNPTIFAYQPEKDATPLDTRERAPLLEPGSVAPDFIVKDAQGKIVKLSDYRGKTVVLDFWATWCWPCNQSLSHTEEIAHNVRDKSVTVLAVAIWDSQKGFDAWIKKHSYPEIHFAIDPKPQGEDVASSLYHVSTTPTAYVIDANGKIVTSIAGYAGPTDELQVAIEAASATKTAQAR